MMHDDRGNQALPELRTLSRSQPPEAVRRRIVEGARLRTLDKAEHPLRRIFVGVALAGAATAALVVTTLTGTMEPGHHIDSARPGHDSVVATLASVGTGGRYSVGPHRVEIENQGRLFFEAVDPGSVRIRLEAGQATFDVEKLDGGDTFEVRTEQVLVQVVGTRFSVASVGGCSEVKVEEGRVRVLSPTAEPSTLGAGEAGRFCESGGRPGSLDLDPTTQGEGLVREALVLVSQARDLDRAAHLLDRYRVEYPNGPFVEEALFHLTLVKARLGFEEEAHDLARTFDRSFPGSPRTEKLQRMIGSPTER